MGLPSLAAATPCLKVVSSLGNAGSRLDLGLLLVGVLVRDLPRVEVLVTFGGVITHVWALDLYESFWVLDATVGQLDGLLGGFRLLVVLLCSVVVF